MTSPLRILYVAYPLLTVSEESAGGAEQVLWTLEREMAVHGATTFVAASAGSRASGELVITGDPCRLPDDFDRRNLEHQDRIVQWIGRHAQSLDLVHDMSGSFWPRAAEIGLPLLATLHLPRHFYAPQLFENVPANVRFNCVSHSQARTFADVPAVAGVVPNGIALDRFSFGVASGRRRGLLWLGRICEEKAPHLAIEIAQRSGLPLTIAGQLYPFSYHRRYFERQVEPLLQRPGVSYIDSPCAEEKHRLLREAEAVLITSQVDETSSLVAMEAAASGTPVVAFRRGALPEVVRDGLSGFLVDSVADAAARLQRIGEIGRDACVQYAEQYFSSSAMYAGYATLYRRMIQSSAAGHAVLRDDKSPIPAV
ncbi:MAG TPA: glycosyltransferase [Candidatus Angelobacter sp.]|nr:glycosyltransferase [Candidatus Angelobacter sp.]